MLRLACVPCPRLKVSCTCVTFAGFWTRCCNSALIPRPRFSLPRSYLRFSTSHSHPPSGQKKGELRCTFAGDHRCKCPVGPLGEFVSSVFFWVLREPPYKSCRRDLSFATAAYRQSSLRQLGGQAPQNGPVSHTANPVSDAFVHCKAVNMAAYVAPRL